MLLGAFCIVFFLHSCRLSFHFLNADSQFGEHTPIVLFQTAIVRRFRKKYFPDNLPSQSRGQICHAGLAIAYWFCLSHRNLLSFITQKDGFHNIHEIYYS